MKKLAKVYKTSYTSPTSSTIYRESTYKFPPDFVEKSPEGVITTSR